MLSHGYIPQGNEKKACATLKNTSTVTSHLLKVPYTYIVHSEPYFHSFLGKKGGDTY